MINNGSYRTAFDYDAFGRPVRIRGGNATGLQVTGYLLWEGDALLAELRPNGEREIDYVYLPGTIDRPFASTLGATAPIDVVFHEIDELGNVVGSHVNGVVSQSNSYDAWGSVTSFSPESHLMWKGLFWTGDSTSLYFMRNRWYDPEGERFLSEDPAGFAGGINLYTFSGNDPVNGRDPFGLCPKGAAVLEHALQLLANHDEVSWAYKCPPQLARVIVMARWPGPAQSDWTVGPTGMPDGGIVQSGGGGRSSGGGAGASVTQRGLACGAAAFDAGAAVAGDLVSLTGFGLIATRATRGASLGIKLARATQWVIHDRVTGSLSPTNSGSLRSINKWATEGLLNVSWIATSNVLQNQPFSLRSELISLIPGVNAGIKLGAAVRACF